MKKYKRFELENFREIFRNKQGNRTLYLTYAFLRGVPYRVVESKTHWDKYEGYKPGRLVYLNFRYGIVRTYMEFILGHQYPDLSESIETRREKANAWNKKHDELRQKLYPELEKWFLESEKGT